MVNFHQVGRKRAFLVERKRIVRDPRQQRILGKQAARLGSTSDICFLYLWERKAARKDASAIRRKVAWGRLAKSHSRGLLCKLVTDHSQCGGTRETHGSLKERPVKRHIPARCFFRLSETGSQRAVD